MARINLLPWREARRKEQLKRFGVTTGMAAGLAALGVVYAITMVGNMVDYQNARNAYLQTTIEQLNEDIRTIRDLKQTKDKLLARMQIIEQLQQRRAEVVHLFDEVLTTKPDGIHLTELQQRDSNLTLKGTAQSNSRVSLYMKNSDASAWLKNPSLVVINVRPQGRGRVSDFTLQMQQANPNKKPTAETTQALPQGGQQ